MSCFLFVCLYANVCLGRPKVVCISIHGTPTLWAYACMDVHGYSMSACLLLGYHTFAGTCEHAIMRVSCIDAAGTMGIADA